MADTSAAPAVSPHGSHRLPAVDVDSYNVELKDDEGFIGDRASKGAFRNMIDNIRKTLRKSGDDPLGEEDSDELSKAELDSLLQGAPEASSKFNLPLALYEMIPTIGEHEASVVLHNDAVVQGLSEIPFMQDVTRWGVLTIGTGLGNARFTNRKD